MPDQQKKIVHFYLTEMLNHVKSMNEHRLGPIPHNIIKRLVHFITATGDAAERFEKLKSIPSLTAFRGFLQGNLDKISSPGFRMSVLMSALESDSERLSQILLPTVATKDQQFRLSDELLAVGFDLELERLYEVHHDKETKRPVDTPATQPVEDAKSTPGGEEFDRVGDVAGFFSRRGRKAPGDQSVTPSVAVDESASSISSNLDEQPGAFADAATFVRELRRTLVKMRSQLNDWPSTGMDQRFLGEAADGFGELKKLANVYSFGDLSAPIGRFEKRLNDVADNRDDQRLALTDQTVEICRNVLDVIEQTDYSDYGTARTSLSASLKRLYSEFEASLTVRARSSRISSGDVAVDTPPVDDVPVDGKELRLDTSRLTAEDYQIFKDEVYSYFDSLDSALLDLRKDRANLSSLRMLQLSLKGLQTASRVLRFGLFLDLVTVSWSGINEIVRRRGMLSEDAHRHLVSLRSVLRLLTEGQPVSENSYHDLKRSLDNLGETTAEIKASPITEMAPVNVARTNADFPENAGWVDDMQVVIDAHKDTISALPARVDVPIDKTEKSEIVPVAVTEPALDLVANLVEADRTVIRPVVRQKEREPSARSDEGRALLDVMANEGAGTDLSLVKLETFVDRIGKDPEDIPEIKHGRIRKVMKRQPAPIETRVTTSASVAPAETETDGSGLMLEENNFQTVDREILDIFIQESEGFFRVFERALSKLKANAKDESAIKDFERTGHSLKSSSRMLGFERISGLAGVLELISERYFEKEVEISENVITLFDDVVRALQGLFRSSKVEVRSILVRLMDLEKKLGAPNILTRNIPGAAELEKILASEAASIPKDEGESSPASYFASIGVDDEIVQIFREESASYFRLIRHALESLESSTAGATALRDIEKAAHSLRSSAKMLGFVKIADLVRPLEAFAERHNKAPFALTPEAMTALHAIASKLESLLRGQDVDISGETAALNAVVESLARIAKTSGATQAGTATTSEGASTPPSKKKKRIVKKKPIEIPDFQIQNEPIFKRLHVEDALLDEMARVTGNA